LSSINERFMTELGRAWHDVRRFQAMWESQSGGARPALKLKTVLQPDFAGQALWGLKNVCAGCCLWLDLLTGSAQTHFVLSLRHPLDVAASLQRRDR